MQEIKLQASPTAYTHPYYAVTSNTVTSYTHIVPINFGGNTTLFRGTDIISLHGFTKLNKAGSQITTSSSGLDLIGLMNKYLLLFYEYNARQLKHLKHSFTSINLATLFQLFF